jgi:hypothetical protein
MNKRRLFLTLVEAFQQVPAKLERISQRDSERETYVHQKKIGFYFITSNFIASYGQVSWQQ